MHVYYETSLLISQGLVSGWLWFRLFYSNIQISFLFSHMELWHLFVLLFQLKMNMAMGKIRCNKTGIVLTRDEDRVSTRNGERGLYQYLSSVQGLGGFQDHFDWYKQHCLSRIFVFWPLFLFLCCCFLYLFRWASNTFSIRGGKPFWVDPFDQNVQHIFIDDNIRQNDEDTIVHPKVLSLIITYFRRWQLNQQEGSIIVQVAMY